MAEILPKGPDPGSGGGYREALPGRPWEARKPALRRLFDEISPGYDRLNRWLSFGLDRRWRAWAVAALGQTRGGRILDLASGTAEMARAFRGGEGAFILRADLSPGLLLHGRRKLAQARGARGARPSPDLACEMERLPLRDGSVDGIVQGFALRHCAGFDHLFAELFRVLAPGGRVSLLDMRYPREGPASGLYRFYFRRVLPRLAALLGGDRGAYELMVDSVRSLPPEGELTRSMENAGFVQVESRPGFLGAVRLLTGTRPRP
jgi:demethylmenaquinone methyltransferase / 2-methoxy-6-polyprenyl-1,4-benzoquinol methylase